jgi:hypothetical protein
MDSRAARSDGPVVREAPPFTHGRLIGIPCTQIALNLGDARAKNVVVLNQGAFARGAHACRAWAAGREGVQV